MVDRAWPQPPPYLPLLPFPLGGGALTNGGCGGLGGQGAYGGGGGWGGLGGKGGVVGGLGEGGLGEGGLGEGGRALGGEGLGLRQHMGVLVPVEHENVVDRPVCFGGDTGKYVM